MRVVKSDGDEWVGAGAALTVSGWFIQGPATSARFLCTIDQALAPLQAITSITANVGGTGGNVLARVCYKNVVGLGDRAVVGNIPAGLASRKRPNRLDPEVYLRELIRVLPHWPRERYLELSPKHWPATRGRLVANELRQEFGAPARGCDAA